MITSDLTVESPKCGSAATAVKGRCGEGALTDTHLVAVEKLATICDPFSNPWNGTAISIDSICNMINDQSLLSDHWEGKEDWPDSKHMARIAYLAEHGWDDPIDIDVGIPSMGFNVRWPVIDGNHRLAAAIIRGDSHIACTISGSVQYAFDLLNVRI